jgi:hypothetical protein
LWLREGVFEELLRCLDVLRRRTSIYKNKPEVQREKQREKQREEQREEQLWKEPPPPVVLRQGQLERPRDYIALVDDL